MTFTEKLIAQREKLNITNTPSERKAGILLADGMQKILEQENFFDPSPITLGVEAEFGLVFDDLTPIPESFRDRVIDLANKFAKDKGDWSFQWEMGASQIEANQEVKAILSNGFNPNELVLLFRTLDEALIPAAHENGVKVLRMGLHPTSKLSGLERTTKSKYIHVPNFHIKNRLEGTQINGSIGAEIEPDASAVGLSQALQFNMSVESPKQGVDVVNWMLQMSPSMLAITGNSRITNGVESGWNDPRNMIWNKTHQTEAGDRVFMPEKFFDNLEDLFNRMGRFPLILSPDSKEVALAISTGLNWLGGKLKFLTDGEDMTIKKILAEFRPMSIQPTPEANAAATLLSFGRLRWSMQNNEKLMPFEIVRENANTAMKEGTSGFFTIKDGEKLRKVDWAELRKIEVSKAIDALSKDGHGTKEELFQFFKDNLPEVPPSTILVDELEKQGGIKNRKVLKDVLIKVLSEQEFLK